MRERWLIGQGIDRPNGAAGRLELSSAKVLDLPGHPGLQPLADMLRGQLALFTTCLGPLDAEQRKHRAAVGPAGWQVSGHRVRPPNWAFRWIQVGYGHVGRVRSIRRRKKEAAHGCIRRLHEAEGESRGGPHAQPWDQRK